MTTKTSTQPKPTTALTAFQLDRSTCWFCGEWLTPTNKAVAETACEACKEVPQ